MLFFECKGARYYGGQIGFTSRFETRRPTAVDCDLVLRVYHGGNLDRSSGGLWASLDADYASAFAQLHDSPLWMLTLDVTAGEMLDLTDCG